MTIKKSDLHRQIIDHFGGDLTGKKITILGWAFKANTNDSRESPAIYISRKLLSLDANLIIYDPKVERDQILKDLEIKNTCNNAEITNNLRDAISKSEAIVILTPWEEISKIKNEKPLFCGHPITSNFFSKTEYTIGKSK
jgi:UDPglucose 6-dehydrogenase